MNKPTCEEFLSEFFKTMLADPENRVDLLKGWARLMELRETSRIIEGLQMARCATNPKSDEEKRIDTMIASEESNLNDQ